MKTVAIISQKGGSGKTTIAVHLAVCAERAKKRIAIIDLDPQGSALEWFNRREAETPEVVRAVPEQLAALSDQVQALGRQMPDLQPLTQRLAALEQRRAVGKVVLRTT